MILGKSRLEAFSDGVFAIAITLLILEIHLPPLRTGSTGEQLANLLRLWPAYLVYAATFATVGIMWLNHNALFHKIELITHEIMIANLALLGTICFLPFLTEALSGYGVSRVTATAYALGFVPISLCFTWLRRAAQRSAGSPSRLNYWNVIGLMTYPVAAATAYVWPMAGIVLVAAIAVFYLLPSNIAAAVVREERDELRAE